MKGVGWDAHWDVRDWSRGATVAQAGERRGAAGYRAASAVGRGKDRKAAEDAKGIETEECGDGTGAKGDWVGGYWVRQRVRPSAGLCGKCCSDCPADERRGAWHSDGARHGARHPKGADKGSKEEPRANE